MAAYTVAVGDHGKYEVALAANTEDVVTFGGGAGDATVTDLTRVEVVHHSGTAPIYVRFGATAVVKADSCRGVVPPGTSAIFEPSTSGDTAVHVISAAAAVYSVINGG